MPETRKDPREGLFELRPVRISFPHLHVLHSAPPTKQVPNPKAKYSCTCIVDQTTLADQVGLKQMQALIAAVKAAAVDKFKDKAAAFMTKILYGKQNSRGEADSDHGIRSPFGDGAEKDFGAGTYTFNLTSDYPFALVDRNNKKVEPVEGHNPAMFYPGCYVRVFVKLRAYNQGGGMGVAIDPMAMQFLADGERLDNRVDPTELCGPLDPAEPGDLTSMLGQAA